MFFVILIACLLDIELILWGEILSWSLVGVKGLKVQGFSFSQCWPTKKNIFFPSFFKSHLQWLLLTFSMYTSCIVIAVEYNKLNVQKKIIYMNINDNFLSDLIFFKSLEFFFVGNKTRICKTIVINIGYYCCCIIFPYYILLHLLFNCMFSYLL